MTLIARVSTPKLAPSAPSKRALALTETSLFALERQVMKLIGKHLVESPIRKDPVTCAEKAKEGVFDMEAEMAQIEQAMQQVHGPTVG